MHEQRKTKQKNDDKTPEGAVPAYLLDREGQSRAKVLSNMIKQKRKEKAVSSTLHFFCKYNHFEMVVQTGGNHANVSDSQECHVFCRANGRCPYQRCVLRERQKC